MTSAPERNAGALVAAVCIAGPALVALIPMAAAPALVAMARHFGAQGSSALFSQIVMTLPAAMLILAAPISGIIAGRTGQRAVLLVSLIFYVIGGAGVLLIADRNMLIALRLLLGLAGGGLLTSSLGLIGDHFSGHRREQILGWATSLSSLLAAAALIGGGWLVDVGGWHAPFALYLLGIPTFIVAYLVIRDARPMTHEPGERGAARELARVWPYYALLILLTLGMFTPAIQVGFLLSARGIGSAQMIGTVIAATSVVATVTAWAFGGLRSRIGLHGLLALDAASMGGGILLIGLATQTWQVFAGCCLVGIGAGMSEPATASVIFRKAPPFVHALAMGVIVSALNAGQFLNPLMFDALHKVTSIGSAFAAFGLLLLAVALFVAARCRTDLLERKIPA